VSRGALVTVLLVAVALLIPIALIGVWTHQVARRVHAIQSVWSDCK
jgi:hypothetical protein